VSGLCCEPMVYCNGLPVQSSWPEVSCGLLCCTVGNLQVLVGMLLAIMGMIWYGNAS